MSLLLLLVLAPLIGMAFGVHTDRDEEFRLEGTAAAVLAAWFCLDGAFVVDWACWCPGAGCWPDRGQRGRGGAGVVSIQAGSTGPSNGET
jgi:hypothetical protein